MKPNWEQNSVGVGVGVVPGIMKPFRPDVRKESHRARLAEALRSSAYIAEPKIDGNHYLLVGGRFLSTKMQVVGGRSTGLPVERTGSLPHLSRVFGGERWRNIVLDGEIYQSGWKASDIRTIMGCASEEAVRRQGGRGWLRYMVFDILRDPEGRWLFDTPWKTRRALLESLEEDLLLASSFIDVVPVIRKDKEAFLDRVLDEGGEGIVLKSVGGLYTPGPLGKPTRPAWNWIKLKVELEDDVVLMGFEPATRAYGGEELRGWPYWEDEVPVTKYWANGWIGAIVFGKYSSGGELVRLGTCSGFDEGLRSRMTREPEKYVGQVIKIGAMERTEDGFYRHPRFGGFHADKNALECRL